MAPSLTGPLAGQLAGLVKNAKITVVQIDDAVRPVLAI